MLFNINPIIILSKVIATVISNIFSGYIRFIPAIT